MFTYICLGSNDLPRSARFYDAVLAPLGLQRCDTGDETDWEDWIGWGHYENGGAYELALWLCRPFNGEVASAGNGCMTAFRCKSWAAVEKAWTAALAHGGQSEGAPGLRTRYNPDFYAAYVRDPDGHKLAFICRGFVAPQAADAPQA